MDKQKRIRIQKLGIVVFGGTLFVVLCVIFFLYRMFSSPQVENTLPGEPVVTRVKSYMLDKSGEHILVIRGVEEDKDEFYYSHVELVLITDKNLEVVKDIRIGAGYINADAYTYMGENYFAFFSDPYDPVGYDDEPSRTLCMIYDYDLNLIYESEIESKDSCDEYFDIYDNRHVNPLYNHDIHGYFEDQFSMDEIKFKEFDGDIHSVLARKCSYCLSNPSKTVIRIGNKKYQRGSSFSPSDNGYYLDNQDNLIIQIGGGLYRIPTK